MNRFRFDKNKCKFLKCKKFNLLKQERCSVLSNELINNVLKASAFPKLDANNVEIAEDIYFECIYELEYLLIS